MLNRRIALFLLLVFLTCNLSSCWSRRELNEMAIVVGAGVDVGQKEKIRLTLQIANPAAFAGGATEGGGGQSSASWTVWSEGETVMDAERLLAQKVPRGIYWGHSSLLVIGEEVARRDITLVTDFFQRDRAPRETAWLTVAKGKAEDILKTHSELSKTSAQAAGFLNHLKTGYSIQVRELPELIAEKGVQPVVTAVAIEKTSLAPEKGDKTEPSNQIALSGVGVFKNEKLIGWMDSGETRGILWLKNMPLIGIINVSSPEEPDKKISISIRGNKTQIIPQYDGQNLSFLVKIKAQGDLVEQEGKEVISTPEKIKALEGQMAKAIEDKIKISVDKAQNEFKVDIFGFGNAFHRKYKREWQELKYRWDEEFSRADIRFDVETNIREIGIATNRLLYYEE